MPWKSRDGHSPYKGAKRERTSRGGEATEVRNLGKKEWFAVWVMDNISYRRVSASALRNPFK